MIVVRVVGTYGQEYSALFADILIERISKIEQCIGLGAAKTASDLRKQNQTITSYEPTVLFNIGCNFSPIDDALRGYTLESSQYNPVVSALVSAFKRYDIEAVYPLGYKLNTNTTAKVAICEITVGIGYASNEMDISRFKDENFRALVSSMMEYLYAVPVEASSRTRGVKNRDQYFLNYITNDTDNNQWHEYTPSITMGDSGNVVAATAGGLPIRALKLTRSTTAIKPYYWYTDFVTNDMLYDHQVLVSVKADRAPANVVLRAGDKLRVFTLRNTNWTMLKMDFKPRDTLETTSSIVCGFYINSKNKEVVEPFDMPCSLIVDGIYKHKIAIGIQTKGTVLITSLAVGMKEMIGAIDSMQASYSVYPPQARPKKKQLLPSFNNSTSSSGSGASISFSDTGLSGTYGSSVGGSATNINTPSTPSYSDAEQSDLGASGSGSGALSEVYDAATGANTLSAKASEVYPESNSGYLEDVDDPSTLLTSDATAFSDTISTILRAKMAADLKKVPIINPEDLTFEYEPLETVMEASDSFLVKQTLGKAVGMLKSHKAAMNVFKGKDDVKKKYKVNKKVITDVTTKINRMLEALANK